MRLYLVGGFLGSGKTTAIGTACSLLLKQGTAVAVITNDQGSQLVDSKFISSLNIFYSEVKNGCFCCNYHQFYDALQTLGTSKHPEIIFAEAVGSCADLVATIVKPLRRFDRAIKTVLSVFADGPQLLSILEGKSFFISNDIQYIYKKQLEETDILIVNKSDLLSNAERQKIKTILSEEYPRKNILFQDSRNESSIENWLELVDKTGSESGAVSLDIDYEKYAKGEAALAWLDSSVIIHSKGGAIQKSFEFICFIAGAISAGNLPIGHLKFFVNGAGLEQKISYAPGSAVSKIEVIKDRTADHATILVNARVETDPDELKRIFYQAIRNTEDQACQIDVLDVSFFQPGYPKPSYRFSD